MAKHGKASPATRPQEEDDSILLRSAETIGRVIGTLQRQLDGARGLFSEFVLDKKIGSNGSNGSRSKPKAIRKNGASKARKTASTAKSASRGAKSTAPRQTVARRKTVARKRAKR